MDIAQSKSLDNYALNECRGTPKIIRSQDRVDLWLCPFYTSANLVVNEWEAAKTSLNSLYRLGFGVSTRAQSISPFVGKGA